ncbi:hypothetical protein LZG00_03830 [Rhodobacteraceae bacterium LMO-12]|nr:hypothetical protein [Rhodobacteraceae bacterium LMO-JJ12]
MSAQIHSLDATRAKSMPFPLPTGALEARDRWGRTPLLRAIVDGTLNDVRTLLDAGADANAALAGDVTLCFDAGETALMLAAPEPAKLALLLAHGADPLAGPDGGLVAWIARELDEDNGEVPEYFDGLVESLALLNKS